jgi:hypothetical protein
MQAEHNTGPIPQGKWEIGKFFNDQRPHGKGPMVCPLIPFPETETFGRTEFMIHGDNKAGITPHPRAASSWDATSGKQSQSARIAHLR